MKNILLVTLITLVFLNFGCSQKQEDNKQEDNYEAAPEFTLNDLDGKAVSLSDYLGKVVVIDFWATWCGPCVRSFPAMQKAVDKYSNDDNVKFLFINTWERGNNVKTNVAKFIADNNYKVHVLLDTDHKVVSAYKVEGVPTKFVIDKKSKIREKSVGFAGSDEALVSKLSVQIEKAKN